MFHPQVDACSSCFMTPFSHSQFDPSEPTSSSGGKARAVQTILSTTDRTIAVMVGDGATDLEAKPPAAATIGFGGIVEREKVRLGADWFVRDFDTIRACLPTSKQQDITE